MPIVLQVQPIYIPLWLNIKSSKNSKQWTGKYLIYIPLWLNIKSRAYKEQRERDYIYIPLWLNIKGDLIKKRN